MTTPEDPHDDTEDEPTHAAIYARVSTKDQDTESQVEVCTQHAKRHPDIDDWTVFADVQSGHDDDRHNYVAMKHLIADGEFDYFICSEFSRISRNDSEIQAFVADCFEREMGFEVVQSGFSVPPAADKIARQTHKIVADVLANLATMENLQKIDRINRGIKHAREVGKWTRKPPAGFYVEDKYLRVDVQEFLEIRDALLDHYYNRTPWSELEQHTSVSRSTLSNIYNDEDRRRLFVYGEGWDKWGRDDEALEEADVPEDVAISHAEAALNDVDLKTYLSLLEDAPEYIDPEAERAREKRERDVSGNERAMLSTMVEALQQAVTDDRELSEEEVLAMYEDNQKTVADVLTDDD